MEFRILGLLEVADGARLVPLPSAKAKMVLAMLVCRANSVVSADALIQGLWRDAPPVTAANTLQTYISQLRKALGAPLISTRSPGYVLLSEPGQIDAGRFEDLLDEGRAALTTDPEHAASVLHQALALWRGPALADFTFEPFAAAEIARLHELRLVTIEHRVEAELAVGVHSQLTGELQQLVREHPLRERLWSQLMLALYRSGRQAEALRAFGELRHTMRDELGIEPSPSVQQLEEAILLQDRQLDWAPPARPAVVVPSNLPVVRSAFVGRESELRDLKKALEQRRLVSLVGPPGVGKSRLANEAARQIVDEYPDGVWLAELFSVTDPSAVAAVVATAIGAPEEEAAETGTGLVDSLRYSRSLVVLDGCDHLLPASAALVDSLLRSCPELSVLVTSREPLRIDGEVVLRLGPMPRPQRDDTPPDGLVEFDSVRLFLDLAGMSEERLVDASIAVAVARLCRRLDGLPLALELAAGRLRALSPLQLAERLDARFRLLAAGSRAGPSHHRSLKAAIDWSYEALPENTRVLFRRLSVFPGQFALEDAETVCAVGDLTENVILDLLSALVDGSLVMVRDDYDTGFSYVLLETLREYAAERLAETGEKEKIHARYLAWQQKSPHFEKLPG